MAYVRLPREARSESDILCFSVIIIIKLPLCKIKFPRYDQGAANIAELENKIANMEDAMAQRTDTYVNAAFLIKATLKTLNLDLRCVFHFTQHRGVYFHKMVAACLGEACVFHATPLRAG